MSRVIIEVEKTVITWAPTRTESDKWQDKKKPRVLAPATS